MKTIAMRLCALLLLAVLALCLTGCDGLDEMRRDHARYTDTGYRADIEYNGALYKCVELPPKTKLSGFAVTRFLYLTDADVPVLLSTTVGTHCERDEESRIIRIYTGAEDRDYVYYVREDLYARALQDLQAEQPYTVIRIRWHNNEEGYRGYYTLTEAERAAVKSVLEQTPTSEPFEHETVVYGSKTIILESPSGLFQNVDYEIVEDERGCAIRTYSDKGETLRYEAHGDVEEQLRELLEKFSE